MLQGAHFAFIHIPKCGGMALRAVLKGVEVGDLMPLGSRCPIKSALHRMPEESPPGKVFTVIRHPAAWLRSFWLDQSPERIGVRRFLHRYWSDDLNEFVTNVCSQTPGYVGKLYRAHIKWPSIRVFKLEDGLELPLQWLGIVQERVEIANASPRMPLLNRHSRRLVAQAERSIMRQFGYAP